MATRNESITTTKLSPLQVHYLKKELIARQIRKEIQLFSEVGSISSLFFWDEIDVNSNDDNNAITNTNNVATTTIKKDEISTPFLRYVFINFVFTFPFLQNVDKFFWVKIKDFLEEFSKKNISSTTTRDEQTKRKRLAEKIVSEVTLMFNAGLKVSSGKEESIKVDFDSLKKHIPYNYKDIEAAYKEYLFISDYEKFINGWNVNVISEFIIQSKRLNTDETQIVARSFKEFKILTMKLKESFPSINVPPAPSKYKIQKKASLNKKNFSNNIDYESEKNRQNLRGHLITLVSIKEIARSKVFRLFITEKPIQLTSEELKEAEKHKELDKFREQQQKLFNKEAEKRTKELEQQVLEFKEELFKSVQESKKITDLPFTYQKIIEYGEISFASTLYSLFIGSDNSSETFSQLKRTHNLMPYRLMKTVMKISNPVGILRSIMDIFLAQPFGQKSLIQRMLSANLYEEIKTLNNDMKIVEESINDPEICEKLRNFVYASSDTQKSIKKDVSAAHSTTLIVAILKSDIISPNLSSEQLGLIEKAMIDYINDRHPSINNDKDHNSNKNKIYRRKKKDKNNLIYLLKRLFFIYIRQRDKEVMIELLFQGITGDLIKDIIAIFYEPLAKIYKAANIGDSLTDVSGFIDELIILVDQIDQKVTKMASSKFSSSDSIIQPFMQLVDRHIPSFYNFVQSIYLHDTSGLFQSMLNWIEKIIDFMRGGTIYDRFDLDKLIDEVLSEEEDEIKALTKEIDDLMLWNTLKKKRRLLKLKNILRNNSDDKSNGLIDGSEGLDDNEENLILKNQDLNDLIDEKLNIKMKFPDLKVLPKLLSPFVELNRQYMVVISSQEYETLPYSDVDDLR
ncbi:7546_t:CDS:10 [Entrophospora sp. SA101]|nr:17912_t:CDS:10 [Entrophospora sp. SA101]CAJ0750777.1 7546_t:CDS:10 [Entrophospora sp. SA101]